MAERIADRQAPVAAGKLFPNVEGASTLPIRPIGPLAGHGSPAS